MLWVEDLQEESMSDNNDLNAFAKNQLKYRAEFYNSDHFLAHAIDSIEKIASLISASLLDGGKLMFCGNGGSAAESQHMAAEYCATLDHNKPREGYRAIALTTDTSFMSAWSNDFGFGGIFERQISVLGEEGDVLVCYSTSGNSENILRAAQLASSKNIDVIAFTGGNGGKLLPLANISFRSPSKETPVIQEHHTVVGHLICSCVEKILEKN